MKIRDIINHLIDLLEDQEDNTPNKTDPVTRGNYQQFLKDAQEESETNRNIGGQFLQFGDEMLNKRGIGFAPQRKADGQKDIIDWGSNAFSKLLDPVKRRIDKYRQDRRMRQGPPIRGPVIGPTRFRPRSIDRRTMGTRINRYNAPSFRNLAYLSTLDPEDARYQQMANRLVGNEPDIVEFLRNERNAGRPVPRNLFNEIGTQNGGRPNTEAVLDWLEHLPDQAMARQIADLLVSRHGLQVPRGDRDTDLARNLANRGRAQEGERLLPLPIHPDDEEVASDADDFGDFSGVGNDESDAEIREILPRVPVQWNSARRRFDFFPQNSDQYQALVNANLVEYDQNVATRFARGNRGMHLTSFGVRPNTIHAAGYNIERGLGRTLQLVHQDEGRGIDPTSDPTQFTNIPIRNPRVAPPPPLADAGAGDPAGGIAAVAADPAAPAGGGGDAGDPAGGIAAVAADPAAPAGGGGDAGDPAGGIAAVAADPVAPAGGGGDAGDPAGGIAAVAADPVAPAPGGRRRRRVRGGMARVVRH